MKNNLLFFVLVHIILVNLQAQKTESIPNDTVKILGFIKNFPSINKTHLINDYIFQPIRNETKDNYIGIYKINLTADTLEYISTKTFLRLYPDKNPTSTNSSNVKDFLLLNDSILLVQGYVYAPGFHDIYTAIRKYNIYGDQHPVEEYIAKNISFVPLLSDDSKIYGSYYAYYGSTAPDALDTGWPIIYHDNIWDQTFVALDKDFNFLWSYYPPDSYSDIDYDGTSTWSLVNLTKLINGNLMLETMFSIINENGDKQSKTRYIELNSVNGEFVRTIWETDLTDSYHSFVQDPYTGDFYAQYTDKTIEGLDREFPVIVKYDNNMQEVAKNDPFYWAYGSFSKKIYFTPDFVVINAYSHLIYLSKKDLIFNKRYPINEPQINDYKKNNISNSTKNRKKIETLPVLMNSSLNFLGHRIKRKFKQPDSHVFFVKNKSNITPPYDESGNLKYYLSTNNATSLVVSDTYNSYCNLNTISNFYENQLYRWVVRFKDDSSLKTYINIDNTPALSVYEYMRRVPSTNSFVPTRDHISWMQLPQDYNFSELDTVNIKTLDLTGTRIPKNWFNIPSTMNYMDSFVEIDTEGRYRIVLITTENENESTSFPYINTKDHMHFLYIYLTTDNLLDIEEHSLPPINIYPNPVESFLNIKSYEKINLIIYDLTGKIIKTYNVDKGNMRINMNSFSKGIYNFKFINKRHIITKKIILK